MIKECNTCTHKEVCSGSYDNVACQLDYEPKRVKCDRDCIKQRYTIDKDERISFIKNTYCPKCGTWIEVK